MHRGRNGRRRWRWLRRRRMRRRIDFVHSPRTTAAQPQQRRGRRFLTRGLWAAAGRDGRGHRPETAGPSALAATAAAAQTSPLAAASVRRLRRRQRRRRLRRPAAPRAPAAVPAAVGRTVFGAATDDGPPPESGPLFRRRRRRRKRRRFRVLYTAKRQRARPVLGLRDAEDPSAASAVRVAHGRGHARPAAPTAGRVPRQDGHVRGRETGGGVRSPPVAAAASPTEPLRSQPATGSAAEASSQVQRRSDRVETRV